MEPSGRQWCARFATSCATADLKQPFRSSVEAFIGALQSAGATVSIAATWRPERRAYLMHYAWLIVKEGINPATVPPMSGVDIDWCHDGNMPSARAAAAEMVLCYGLRYRPSLHSRHIQRRAIDMKIVWHGTITPMNANGEEVFLSWETGKGVPESLIALGAGYGVHKLRSDPPHWSDDGH